jgi:hypothetical protein
MPYGNLLADVVQSSVTGTPPQFNDGAGTQTGTLCRAWVNYKGTATRSIRASFNVSSVTYNTTGDYTINFTTAMPDVNYSFVHQMDWGNTAFGASGRATCIVSLATTTAQIRTGFLNGTAVFTAEDEAVICAAVFR